MKNIRRLVFPLVGLLLGVPAWAAATRSPLREYDVLREFAARFAELSRHDLPDANGLTGTNRKHGSWLEAGPQRGSCRAVIAAVVTDDLARADLAWRGIEVAFSHQRADGGFEANLRPNGKSAREGAAAVETAFFFLQELGRALLVIQQSPHEAHFRARIEALRPKVRKACDFISAGYDDIIATTSHAANRIIIAAKAFGTCGIFLGDERLVGQARGLIAHALTLRDDAGVFLEKGGRDSSYNVVSILFGQVLALHVPLPEFEAALPAAIEWQLGRVLPSGEVDVRGNTRTGVGKEVSYHGEPKNVNYTEVVLALTYYGTVRRDARALDAARRVFDYSRRTGK